MSCEYDEVWDPIYALYWAMSSGRPESELCTLLSEAATITMLALSDFMISHGYDITMSIFGKFFIEARSRGLISNIDLWTDIVRSIGEKNIVPTPRHLKELFFTAERLQDASLRYLAPLLKSFE